MASHFRTFAIAGGTGKLGKPLALELNKFASRVVVLSRGDSSQQETVWSSGVVQRNVDYQDVGALKAAIGDCDVVINALSAMATMSGIDKNLEVAALETKRSLYVPAEFGMDPEYIVQANNPPMHPFHAKKLSNREHFRQIGLPFVSFNAGLYASALPRLSMANFQEHTCTIVGDGNTPFITSSEETIAAFVGSSFATLTREQLLQQGVLNCVGSRLTFNELLARLQRRDGVAWKVSHVPVEEARAIASNPSMGMQSVLSWLLLTNETGSNNRPGDSHELVNFVSTDDPCRFWTSD